MRRIINSTYITLDGIIEPAGWPSGPHQDDERRDPNRAAPELRRSLLLGRRTYGGYVPSQIALAGTAGSSASNKRAITCGGIRTSRQTGQSSMLPTLLRFDTTALLTQGQLGEAIRSAGQPPRPRSCRAMSD